IGGEEAGSGGDVQGRLILGIAEGDQAGCFLVVQVTTYSVGPGDSIGTGPELAIAIDADELFERAGVESLDIPELWRVVVGPGTSPIIEGVADTGGPDNLALVDLHLLRDCSYIMEFHRPAILLLPLVDLTAKAGVKLALELDEQIHRIGDTLGG